MDAIGRALEANRVILDAGILDQKQSGHRMWRGACSC